MELTVNKINIVVDKKQGYAFLDKDGYCIMITYGESNVKIWKEYLEKNDTTNTTIRK